MEGGSSALASTEGAGNKGVACPHVTRRAPHILLWGSASNIRKKTKNNGLGGREVGYGGGGICAPSRS